MIFSSRIELGQIQLTRVWHIQPINRNPPDAENKLHRNEWINAQISFIFQNSWSSHSSERNLARQKAIKSKMKWMKTQKTTTNSLHRIVCKWCELFVHKRNDRVANKTKLVTEQQNKSTNDMQWFISRFLVWNRFIFSIRRNDHFTLWTCTIVLESVFQQSYVHKMQLITTNGPRYCCWCTV